MNRRRFLMLGSSGLAAAALPEVLGCSREPAPGPRFVLPERVDLAMAMSRAQASGRPLLILVGSAEIEPALYRGDVFGTLLAQGSDEVMADLALCDLICASSDQVARVIPATAAAVNPWIVFVEPDGAAPRVGSFPPPVASIPGPSATEVRTAAKAVEDRIREWIAPYARSNADRTALAEAAKARLRTASPPGARWARNLGCGIEYEQMTPEEEVQRSLCGAGSIGYAPERFLHFYTQP